MVCAKFYGHLEVKSDSVVGGVVGGMSSISRMSGNVCGGGGEEGLQREVTAERGHCDMTLPDVTHNC